MKGKLSKSNEKWIIICSLNNELTEYELHPKELQNYDRMINIHIHHPHVNFEVVNEAYDVTKDGEQILYKDFAILLEPTDIKQAAVFYAASSIKDFKLGAEWMSKRCYTEDDIVKALKYAQDVNDTSYAKLWTIIKNSLNDERSNNER
jgi:hypothetical protein